MPKHTFSNRPKKKRRFANLNNTSPVKIRKEFKKLQEEVKKIDAQEKAFREEIDTLSKIFLRSLMGKPRPKGRKGKSIADIQAERRKLMARKNRIEKRAKVLHARFREIIIRQKMFPRD